MKDIEIALPNEISQHIILPTIMGHYLFYIFSPKPGIISL